MAKSSNYKLKLLFLVKMFKEETDEEHGMKLSQIRDYLEAYSIHADRKTLYQDFEALRDFGYDIIKVKVDKQFYYYLGNRDFDLPELKLLVDAVQSAKFLTEKRSNELIKKLETLTSKQQAKKLQRQVLIAGRVKASNEKIYYNVDELHEAISLDSRISFYYSQWTVDKEMQLRKNGKLYQTSPWALMWDDENYYLVGFDDEDQIVKHYRVDKMSRITVLGEPRNGKEQFKAFNLPKYTKSLFGMFGGEETMVTLKAENDMVGTVIDRFGKDITILKTDEGHFKTVVNVAVSNQFIGWIISLGESVSVEGPESVKEKMREEIKRLQKQYL